MGNIMCTTATHLVLPAQHFVSTTAVFLRLCRWQLYLLLFGVFWWLCLTQSSLRWCIQSFQDCICVLMSR